MARSLHPLVESILEERYQQILLNENIASDAWEGVKSGWGKFRGSWEKKREELGQKLQDIAVDTGFADFASEYIPGVAGMSVVEVPLSKQDPKAYDKARSELATELVKARKQAFDNKEADVSETDILSRAIANKPELAKILTKDEYESLSGGSITNPLQINVKKTDKEGRESESPAIVMQKWSGMDQGAEILYRTLRGAEEGLLTPEGIATGAAFGAGFKAAGAAAGAAGRALVPKVLPQATKVAQFIPGAARARGAEELGTALGQKAVGAAGLGLVGVGAYQAKQADKLPEFSGSLLGGILPFGVGAKGAEITGKGIKAARAPELNVLGEPLQKVSGQEPIKMPEPEWVGKKYPEFKLPEKIESPKIKNPKLETPKEQEPKITQEPKQEIGYGEFKAVPETLRDLATARQEGRGTWTPGSKPENYYKLQPETWKFGQQPGGRLIGEPLKVEVPSETKKSIYDVGEPQQSPFDRVFFPYGKPAGPGKVISEPIGLPRIQPDSPATTKAPTTGQKISATGRAIGGALTLIGPEALTRTPEVKTPASEVARTVAPKENQPKIVLREPAKQSETKTQKIEIQTKEKIGGTKENAPIGFVSQDKDKETTIRTTKETEQSVDKEKEDTINKVQEIAPSVFQIGIQDLIPHRVKDAIRVTDTITDTKLPPPPPPPPPRQLENRGKSPKPTEKIPPIVPGGTNAAGSAGMRFEKMRGAMVNNDINALLRNIYSISQTLSIA